MFPGKNLEQRNPMFHSRRYPHVGIESRPVSKTFLPQCLKVCGFGKVREGEVLCLYVLLLLLLLYFFN